MTVSFRNRTVFLEGRFIHLYYVLVFLPWKNSFNLFEIFQIFVVNLFDSDISEVIRYFFQGSFTVIVDNNVFFLESCDYLKVFVPRWYIIFDSCLLDDA